MKLETFDFSYFIDKKHSDDDESQNYMVLLIKPLDENLRDCETKVSHLLIYQTIVLL